MRNEPCKKCHSYDFYYRGTFSYCRPCHVEAQKRYVERKRFGEAVELVGPPVKLLHEYDFSLNTERAKLACAKGHSLIGDNVRVSSQRQGKHVHRRCLTCERNNKRVRYGLAPEADPVRLTDMLDS